ncbi:hypothetical protein [Streptomyces olivochromogenes]|uniref:hypothetical protein n=1 Tax=Streptomyces olivochromogenes TaxID=1963 RepID=UPI001F2D113F|nr:hypothetical protein [Streptomyces olivochromogenes]MCF3134166.1 hypothetical protein [Streptomyces olivochromogenes]
MLPGSRSAGRRYGRAAYRQAAWRARRRWRHAEAARRTMVSAGCVLLVHIEGELAGIAAGDGGVPDRAAHCTAVARIPRLTDHLVRLAVLADRQAGASWPQIGRALGISGEAARARCTRRGTAGSRPGQGDVPPR